MLIVLGGLPGTGKTSLACRLARSLSALHLRIDTIEQAILASCSSRNEVGADGYAVAYGIALDNLRLGLTVVADSVNPLPVTRTAWRQTAEQAGVRIMEIELTCSDPAEHRRRIETRLEAGRDVGKTAGLPSWQDVLDRDYAAWDREHIIIDTARHSIEQALAKLGNQLSAIRSGKS